MTTSEFSATVEAAVVEFTLNGEPVSVQADQETSMLELLREQFGLVSVKDGCAPEGSCGACTVLVDGHAQVCCAQKVAHFAGKHIVTHEGLADEERKRFADCFALGSSSPIAERKTSLVKKNFPSFGTSMI